MSMMTAKVSRYQKLPILWPMRQAMTMKIEPQMASVGMTVAAQRGFVGRLLHPVDEDRNVEGIDGDDGQLGGIKEENDAFKRRADKGDGMAPGAGEVGR